MDIVLSFFSLWTGSWKSVSVCGVNAAFVARPSTGARARSIGAYAVGLLAGALAVTLTIASAGAALNALLAVPLQVRVALVGSSCLLLGAGELVRGAWLLPHIGWAVPRRWAAAVPETPFLLIFGLIRGLVLFNHSPFASFHAWILAVFLLHDELPMIAVGACLAIGLGLWTVAYGLAWLATRNGRWVFDMLAARSLAATAQLGRLDGLGLVAVGAAILALR